ncbi:DUF3137 domain-containing protein [uncultured Hyphomonas sp.]|uniref:DUF3137 domain-containing protein n=1 Tax=uncultured Hyphomonas sp. TaxID=225298 RepID=UPI002AAAB927|nr:DUF3137 domain-containing protein [uncultured Hyphomonas sp.]
MTDQPEIDPAILEAMDGLRDEFAGFAEIYQSEIRPALQERENDREQAVSKARKFRYIGIGLGLLIALIGIVGFKSPFGPFLGVIVGFGLVTWGGQDLKKFGKEAKELLVQPVVRQLGLNFEAEPGEVASIHEHKKVGIVPSWDRASYEDRLTGSRDNVEFELFEAHLEEKHRSTDSKGRTTTRWVTVFKGQCLRFHFDKTFYGRTLVTRDAGFFNRFGGGKGMKRASLEDPQFEKIFEVYTTDQVESRYLLTPDLMQELVNLENAFHGGKLKCCFYGGEMYITLQGGNLFEPGSMFTPLDSPNRLRELLEDFAAVFHIIDVTNRNRRRRSEQEAPEA